MFKVDDSTINKTTRCEKNFSCLPKKRKDLCKVTYTVEDKVYFVECQNTEPCSYVVPFGHSFFCSCPVRKEVYVRYNI
jgi:hypothetical protein